MPVGLLIDVFCLNTNSPAVACINHFSLRNTGFQKNLYAVGELTIGLVLVISCEPVKVETESKNFSALEVHVRSQ